jgi:hypothetical protein
MGDSFEPECQSEASWIQQEAADHTRPMTSQDSEPFDILGCGHLSGIEWTLIIDKTEEPFLHIDDLPDDASKHTKWFEALGFSQAALCVPLTDVITKIQQHTAGKTNTPINELRYVPYSNISFMQVSHIFISQLSTIQIQSCCIFEKDFLFQPS